MNSKVTWCTPYSDLSQMNAPWGRGSEFRR
jgi:hypothetical protein